VEGLSLKARHEFLRRHLALLFQDKPVAFAAFSGKRTTAEVTHGIPPGFKVITTRLQNTLLRVFMLAY
jgi:hypothetical protein